ncbi:hypothetical protein [Piscirickettsia litoralis]|uniref:Uncharacterized protein n=1 Tax=Piscirickettsia litoralis TaxID=1891921 RepID=A0ABX3A384_9GAMM|nr:hypothetical protein [Piscirickettsia litoralis]ODN42096.1 hypothetical protein BGC07_02950 [Piscirickettsia litoralis]
MKYRQWRYRMTAWYQSALGEEISSMCEQRLSTWLNRCGGQVGLSLGVPLSPKLRELFAENFFTVSAQLIIHLVMKNLRR